MRANGTDYLIYDQENGIYREDPEQAVRDDVEKHYWLNVLRAIIKDWRLYLMLVPMLLVFLLWRYLPMYELLRAFKVDGSEAQSVSEWAYKGFSNFRALLIGTGTNAALSQEFWMSLRNTFLLSFYGLCFGFPMPIILALFFNEIRSNAARSVLQVMTYLPKFMSTVIMTSLVVMLVKGARQPPANWRRLPASSPSCWSTWGSFPKRRPMRACSGARIISGRFTR